MDGGGTRTLIPLGVADTADEPRPGPISADSIRRSLEQGRRVLDHSENTVARVQRHIDRAEEVLRQLRLGGRVTLPR